MQHRQQATDSQSLKTILLITAFFYLFLGFLFSGVAIYNLDFEDDKEAQSNANWVKPITAQEEKQEVKSFWSLTLKFEEGGNDE